MSDDATLRSRCCLLTNLGRLHGAGIVLCAVSQYLYLVKFFIWEIGYMRSIDIIVDRAGFYETWGCLVWVPSVYTLHTRLLVTSPSGLSWEVRSLDLACTVVIAL